MTVHLITDVKPDGSHRVVRTRCGRKVSVRMADSLAGEGLTGWSCQITCPTCQGSLT